MRCAEPRTTRPQKSAGLADSPCATGFAISTELESGQEVLFRSGGPVCIMPHYWGTRWRLISKPGEETMSDTNSQEMVSRNMLALFLIGGSLGAIIMSWIAYVAMIGRAL